MSTAYRFDRAPDGTPTRLRIVAYSPRRLLDLARRDFRFARSPAWTRERREHRVTHPDGLRVWVWRDGGAWWAVRWYGDRLESVTRPTAGEAAWTLVVGECGPPLPGASLPRDPEAWRPGPGCRWLVTDGARLRIEHHPDRVCSWGWWRTGEAVAFGWAATWDEAVAALEGAAGRRQ